MTFWELKKQIYYFARKFIKIPHKNENEQKILGFKKDMKELEEIIIKINGKLDDENIIDFKKTIELIDKEYNKIFGKEDNENKNDEFFNDFPYIITLTKTFGDKNHIILFNGKNNFGNLKEFNISKNNDPIAALIQNKDYCINLILKKNNNYTISKINLNSYISYEGKDVVKKFNYNYKLSLDDLLEYFCSDEYLDEGNGWKCGNCKKRVTITKKFSIFYVPRLLIICLKRFSRSGYGYSKNQAFINFPIENLDMGKYICGPDKQYSKYDLFAVSQHYGGTGGGHYTAVCKNIDGKWYGYNDSSVSNSSGGSAVSSAAYVLFYRRKNW